MTQSNAYPWCISMFSCISCQFMKELLCLACSFSCRRVMENTVNGSSDMLILVSLMSIARKVMISFYKHSSIINVQPRKFISFDVFGMEKSLFYNAVKGHSINFPILCFSFEIFDNAFADNLVIDRKSV